MIAQVCHAIALGYLVGSVDHALGVPYSDCREWWGELYPESRVAQRAFIRLWRLSWQVSRWSLESKLCKVLHSLAQKVCKSLRSRSRTRPVV